MILNKTAPNFENLYIFLIIPRSNKSIHIAINDNTKLSYIKEIFSNFYPYLQIEFYKINRSKFNASIANNKLDSSHKIGDIINTHLSGVLEMNPLDKVADVEIEILIRFGLSVLILKKYKLEQPNIIDDFSLKMLNEMGRSSFVEFYQRY